eukprot:3461447-Pyramimonas_sp.AAC.1
MVCLPKMLHPECMSKVGFPCAYTLVRDNTPSTKTLTCVLAGVAIGVGISKYMRCGKKSCSKAADAPVDAGTNAEQSTTVRSTASSGAVKGGGPAVYESSRAVQEYLCFHFLRDRLIPFDCAPKNAIDFPKRCAELCKKHSGKQNRLALDLGCAVGASTFELSKYYGEVVGLDFSHAFIDAAKKMQSEKAAAVTIQQEGEIFVDMV